MKAVDLEIRELEQRMARRRHEVADTARAARQRATAKLLSPTGLAIAAGLGFALFARRRPPPAERRRSMKRGKASSLLSFAMPIALSLVKAQFGGPAGLANYVLSRFQRTASPHGDVRAPVTRQAPRTVHPAR